MQVLLQQQLADVEEPTLQHPCLFVVLVTPELLGLSSWCNKVRREQAALDDIVQKLCSEEVKTMILARCQYVVSEGRDLAWKSFCSTPTKKESMRRALHRLAEVVKRIEVSIRPDDEEDRANED